MRMLLGGLLLSLSFLVSANAADSMTINVDVNQPQFQVSLEANPTTGYQWSVQEYDQSFLQLSSSQFIAPTTKLIGAGGMMVYTFELINGKTYPQTTEMVFKYAQPWEPKKGSLKKVIVNFKKN